MKAITYKILAHVAYYLRLWRLLYWLFPIINKKHILTVLTFHRIVPRESTKSFAAYYDIGYDNKLYECLLKELNRYFDFINLDDFIKYASGEEKFTRHSMLITFDDADSDLITYAAPALYRNNWPAVVFAPIAYIGSDDVFWHLKITDMMYQMDNAKWQILKKHKHIFPGEIQNILDKHDTYKNCLHLPLCRDFLVHLNRLKDNDIQVIIAGFEKLIGGTYSLGIKCMNWEQLAQLEQHGIKVESHTVSHRKLIYLDDEEVLTELKKSKSVIEGKFNKQVTALCYPAGAYNSKTTDLTSKAHYKVAFTNTKDNIRYPLRDLDFLKIPRNTFGGKNKIEMNCEIGKLLIKNNA